MARFIKLAKASEIDRARGRKLPPLRREGFGSVPLIERHLWQQFRDVFLGDEEAKRLSEWGMANRAFVERVPEGRFRYASFKHHKVVTLPVRSETSYDR